MKLSAHQIWVKVKKEKLSDDQYKQLLIDNDIIINYFNEKDIVIAFNSIEWSKTGDLPNDNDIYYQEAKILKIRKSTNGEMVADVEFKNGQVSNGHFLGTLSKKLTK